MKKIILLFLFTSASIFGQLNTEVMEWKNKFDTRYFFKGNYEEKGWRDALNISRDNGDLYITQYVANGLFLMWQATGDDFYIQEFIVFYQGWFDRARPASEIGLGDYKANNFQYFDDDFLSWVDYPRATNMRRSDGMRINFTGGNLGVSHFQVSNSDGHQQYSLPEGTGLRTVTDALYVMFKSPKWRAKGTNQKKYESLLNFIEINVWKKWETRAGDHLYRERTHMSSHYADMAMNLYLITGKSNYFTVFDRWFTNMGAWNSYPGKRNYPYYGMANGQLRIHKDGGYVWDGVWGGKGANDANHSNAEVGTIIRSIELGFNYFSLKDLYKFKITFDRIKKDDTHGWFFIDGTSHGVKDSFLINTFDATGWLMLAGYYPSILENMKNFSIVGSVFRARLYASGAYSCAKLNGDLFYPEQKQK